MRGPIKKYKLSLGFYVQMGSTLVEYPYHPRRGNIWGVFIFKILKEGHLKRGGFFKNMHFIFYKRATLFPPGLVFLTPILSFCLKCVCIFMPQFLIKYG
jgi:hypothetical protein